MSLVGKEFTNFVAPAVVNGSTIVEKFSLASILWKKKCAMLVFYPKDFTFVCPTELLALQDKLSEFESRNVQVVGISTDTENVHMAWLDTEIRNGGIKGVTYPLVADMSKDISKAYGVLSADHVAYRGTVFIDEIGTIRYHSVNDFPIGRNVDELLRIVDAWKTYKEHGDVCPANWKPNTPTLAATREGVKKYLSEKYKL